MRSAKIFFLVIVVTVLFTSFAAASPITATPSKDKYNPGETLVVSGIATPNSAVAIQVYNPSATLVGVNQVTIGADGQYSIAVLTWPGTALPNFPFGIYIVRATDSSTAESVDITVEFVQPGDQTTTTTTDGTITITTTVTSTRTSTTTSKTTVTSTSTSTSTSTTTTTSRVTSTRTSTTTLTTTLPAQTTTITSTSRTTSTSISTQTITSTVVSTEPPITTTVVSKITEEIGFPAEYTYAALAVAAVAIIAAVVLLMRRRA